GREQVSRVCAALLVKGGFDTREIWHSPLARSRETAQLLAQGLGLKAPLLLKPGLGPDDDATRFAAVLEAAAPGLTVVGHEPHLGVLACSMVHGPDRPAIFYPFPKAGVLALSRGPKGWRGEWLVRSP
ncbi:MAG TPA: histidine phosphatase family protein, partial [Opitutaceae bacterium]